MCNLLTFSVSAFLVLCIATIGINGDEVKKSKFDPETIKKGIAECAKEAMIKDDEIKHLKELFRKPQAAPPSKEFLCFIKCTGTKFDYIDAAGMVNTKYILERTANWPELKKDELQACLEKNNKMATCDNITDLIKCFQTSIHP